MSKKELVLNAKAKIDTRSQDTVKWCARNEQTEQFHNVHKCIITTNLQAQCVGGDSMWEVTVCGR